MFTKFTEFKSVMPMAALISFLICVIILPMLIPLLRKLKFGQSIRQEGPKWHQKKSGTPPMGGIAFIVAIALSCIITIVSPAAMLIVFTAVAFGIIGFADDYIKVVLKRNLGLSAKQKFLLQLLVSVGFIIIGRYFDIVKTDIYIPFMKNSVDIGYFIIPVSVFIMTGFSNAVNLTDGIDGLATSVTAVVSVFLAIISIFSNHRDVAVVCASVFGACVGFLIFNFHPAKVFMGDTGSLFFGGFVSAAAMVLKIPIIIVVLGFVYVAETLSVMIQVVYFKKTGKRIFKMSPIHHHFEMCGWSEVKIVGIFSLASVVCGLVALALMYSVLA